MPELPVVTARASEQIKSGSLLAHFCEVSKSWFLWMESGWIQRLLLFALPGGYRNNNNGNYNNMGNNGYFWSSTANNSNNAWNRNLNYNNSNVNRNNNNKQNWILVDISCQWTGLCCLKKSKLVLIDTTAKLSLIYLSYYTWLKEQSSAIQPNTAGLKENLRIGKIFQMIKVCFIRTLTVAYPLAISHPSYLEISIWATLIILSKGI